ncbi:MAG: hypothetical protein ACR2O6_09950 [Ilumatobacteraceae bacterium]
MTSLPPPEVGVHDGAQGEAATASAASGGSAVPIGGRRVIGQLTVAWQIMGAVAWAAAFFAFAGVWKASEEIGIATWWLGPRADPQPITIRILPFVLCVFIGLWAIYNVRGFPWVSLAGSVAVAAIAAFDVSRSIGLAAAEFAIAGALALVSLASLGGRYRAGTAPPADDGAGEPPPTGPPSPETAPTGR